MQEVFIVREGVTCNNVDCQCYTCSGQCECDRDCDDCINLLKDCEWKIIKSEVVVNEKYYIK